MPMPLAEIAATLDTPFAPSRPETFSSSTLPDRFAALAVASVSL